MAIPAVRELADELTDLTNKISKIVNRDDLDVGEKLDRIFDVAKVDAQPWIDKLGDAIGEADIPEKVGKAVSAATPMLLATAGTPAEGRRGVRGTRSRLPTYGASSSIGGLAAKKVGIGGGMLGGMSNRGGSPAAPVFVKDIAIAGGIGGGGGVLAPGGLGKLKGLAKGAGKLGLQGAAIDFAINLVSTKGEPISAAVNSASDLTFGLVPKLKKPDAKVVVNEDRAVATKNGVNLDSQGFAISDRDGRPSSPPVTLRRGARRSCRRARSPRRGSTGSQRIGSRRGASSPGCSPRWMTSSPRRARLRRTRSSAWRRS